MAPQEPWLWRDLTPLHLSLVAKNYATADVLIEAGLCAEVGPVALQTLRWLMITGEQSDDH